MKSIHDKFGMSQQDMATLPCMTREHYSMITLGTNTLPCPMAKKKTACAVKAAGLTTGVTYQIANTFKAKKRYIKLYLRNDNTFCKIAKH